MKQKIAEFLFDIAQTYPIRSGLNAEQVFEDARTYLIGKCYNKDFDFNKAKSLLFDDYKQKSFPLPKEILTYLMQAEIKNYHECENEGSLIAITLPNGITYDFTVSGIGRPLGVIKNEIHEKYGQCEIKTYPKGTVRIGNSFILP